MEVILLRLALAVVFGAIIGFEREWRQKHAGIKTNALVALGAAGFAVMSNTFGEGNHNPAQLAAAVVSGIGFIGAGVILRRGGSVQGVTTAATLWANASMGVALGVGHYSVGCAVFGGVVFVQFSGPRIGTLIARHREPPPEQFDVRIEVDPAEIRSVTATLDQFAAGAQARAMRRATLHDKSITRVTFRIGAETPIDISPLEERLGELPGVRQFEIRHVAPDEDF